MTGAVFCAPMAMEARALTGGRHGLPTHQVLHTGVGARRSTRDAPAPPLRDAEAVAVVGIAGGLDPCLRPGDVVVADEVRGPDGSTHRLPVAPMAAAHLRRSGLRVHIGPVVSSRRIVSGAGRASLAADGALAVDTETAWLVDARRPALVVRVVADTASDRLLSPATLARVRTAVRTLRETVPTLRTWADAVSPREVLLAGPRSFCAGVERAVATVEKALEQHGAPLYVRKQIVHNRQVVGSLRERGAVFVDDLEEVPPGSTVVFSAHGVAPEVWRQAKARDLRVVDATCPLVSKVHTEVRRFGDRGDTVLFIGHAGHEETEGTMGERPDRTVLVETLEDARTVEVADPDRVAYLVQTTLAAAEVDEIVQVLRRRFPAIAAPASDDICYATTNRQDALAAVAGDADLVLVVGSANSSNSRRLVETATRLGAVAHLVDGAGDIDLEWLVGARAIGLTAGASAPELLVDEVVDALSGLGPVRVRTRTMTTENVRFTLPKEVRTA